MFTRAQLHRQRSVLEHAWNLHVPAICGIRRTDAVRAGVRTEIVASRERPAAHIMPAVGEAPLADADGRQLGVLDLSTTWDRSHPIGPATAEALARLLGREVRDTPQAPPPEPPRGGLLELGLLDGTRGRQPAGGQPGQPYDDPLSPRRAT